MNLELELYQIALLVAGAINYLIAIALLHNNIWYRIYDVYFRSRIIVAINYLIFGTGFLMHYCLQWRDQWPLAATALSVSYFHIGAVLFGWSHTSLLRPDYLSPRIVLRDMMILAAGLTAYWTTAIFPLYNLSLPAYILQLQYFIFFIHAGFIASIFYRTYFQVRRELMSLPTDTVEQHWWTPETKRTVLHRHHSFIIASNLIVLFGLGSIVVTALLPKAIWPYTLLLVAGIAVFIYIFYSLSEYGTVIESASCATEDVILQRDKQQKNLNK